MPFDPDVQGILDAATAEETVEASVAVSIAGWAAIYQAKIDAAKASGALTPEAHASLQATTTAMKASSDALAAAVVANTPAA